MWNLRRTHTHILTFRIHFDTSRLGCRGRPAALFINICHHTGGSELLSRASPALQKLFLKSTLPFSARFTSCSAMLPVPTLYDRNAELRWNASHKRDISKAGTAAYIYSGVNSLFSAPVVKTDLARNFAKCIFLLLRERSCWRIGSNTAAPMIRHCGVPLT